jgi:hypothetical protein
MKSEARITADIRKALRPMELAGTLFVVKVAGGPRQRRGLPDLLLVFKGRAIWLEIKALGEYPTPLQEATLRKIRGAGGIAECVRCAGHVLSILRGIE